MLSSFCRALEFFRRWNDRKPKPSATPHESLKTTLTYIKHNIYNNKFSNVYLTNMGVWAYDNITLLTMARTNSGHC